MSLGSSNINNDFQPAAEQVPGLTDEEKRKLEEVIRKAKEFDAEESNKMRKPVEGQLYKYTNVMRGWQFRWFVLTPDTGMFEYYMDEIKKTRPRGGLHLAGSVITLSDDDDQAFTVSTVYGDVYKLKASDCIERQFWVNRLRATAKLYTHSGFLTDTSSSTNLAQSHSGSRRDLSSSPSTKFDVSEKKSTLPKSIPESSAAPENKIPTITETLCSIKNHVDKATSSQKALMHMIEELPLDGDSIKCSDTSLLLLKATSQAAVQSLEQCYLILRQRQCTVTHPRGLPPGATIQWVNTKTQSPTTNT